VTVFVDGVRDSGGILTSLGVPGLLASPLGIGLSFCDLMDSEDGALDAENISHL
jgi:hypothetical protein